MHRAKFHRPVLLALAANLVAGTATTPAHAQPAREPEPNWPCVQVYVPELSPGVLWAGPPLDSVEDRWRDDPAVRKLVNASAGMAPEAFEAEVVALAEAAGPQRNAALTALFAGIFETHANKRRAMIQGVKRYDRQQQTLHKRIAATLAVLDTAPQDSAEAKAAEETLHWQRRILDDRRRTLEAVCDQPVLVEQRLGVLTRIIAAHLE